MRMSRALAVLLAVCAGCSNSAGPGAAIKGRVTCAGRPLANGLIVFTPDTERGQRGPGAQVRLDADGRYALPGGHASRLAPGWYRVTIAGPVDALESGPRVAERYRYPERSGLEAEVRDQPEYEFNFDLDGP